jgi:YVTN family beta-propeller protein
VVVVTVVIVLVRGLIVVLRSLVSPGGAAPRLAGSIPVAGNPSSLAMARNRRYAYVTNEGSATVAVIDTATNTVVATINVGNSPVTVVVTPDGRHAYVINAGSGTVSVTDTGI